MREHFWVLTSKHWGLVMNKWALGRVELLAQFNTCIKGTTEIIQAGVGTWQQSRKELWKAVRMVGRRGERKRVWAVGVEASLHLAAVRHFKQARFVAMYIQQSLGKLSCCYGACNSLTVLNSLRMALQGAVSPLATPGPQHVFEAAKNSSLCSGCIFFKG